ncbi:MAG: aldose epimerase family protein [Paracoccaceae bacterium]
MTPFGTTSNGCDVHKLTLTAGDLTVSLLTLGAIVQDVRLAGVDHSLTHGSDDLADYEGAMGYHGAIVGPIANRISTSRVRIDGLDYELERNEAGKTHLHSGSGGTHRRIWTVAAQSDRSATLVCDLPDGEAGLPGNRRIEATFTVTEDAALTLTISGTTDAKTVMNFANHGYWNLDGSDSWKGHSLQIAADHYLPITDAVVPTGEVAPVTGTEMDFRAGKKPRPGAPALDHNFCLSDSTVETRHVLTLTGESGLALELFTDQPGLQVFDGRPAYRAFALEAQGWPDAPTQGAFPSVMVTPDRPYRQRTRWHFSRPS